MVCQSSSLLHIERQKRKGEAAETTEAKMLPYRIKLLRKEG
jgi:hypothetical protein